MPNASAPHPLLSAARQVIADLLLLPTIRPKRALDAVNFTQACHHPVSRRHQRQPQSPDVYPQGKYNLLRH